MTSDYRQIIIDWTRRYWVTLCLVPVALTLVFQVSKPFLRQRLPQTPGSGILHADAVLLIALALAGAVAILVWSGKVARLLPLLVAAISLMGSVGVLLQESRSVSWEGMDVPTNNYRAALLSMEIGPLALVETWNARANPYVTKDQYMQRPEELVDKIERLDLKWIAGTRWDRLDLPQDNNRMFMHPPGYPLALGIWMKGAGTARHSAMVFELLVKFALVAMTSFWVMSVIPATCTLERAVLSLVIATAPPLVRSVLPHANELAALLALSGFILGSGENRRCRNLRYFASGVFLCLATYVNFFYGIVALAAGLFLLFYKKNWKTGLVPLMGLGGFSVVTVFAALGYYPWLTLLTGTMVTSNYRIFHHSNRLQAFPLFIGDFGPAILLLFFIGLLIFQSLRSQERGYWVVAPIFALILASYQSLGLGSGGHYVIGIFCLMVPILSFALMELKLNRMQSVASCVSNLLMLSLMLFL